ncbi:hypothetical protein [Methyloterricola oryzae]|uniref:hypothetical protein n=1 Tax=Methyloterricola oryzae TaxID=1495050 RepID=UPI0009E54EC5|nr:hypothetical protein [Methyloterricola oryzae]
MSAYAQKYCHVVADLLLRRIDLTHETLINMGCGWRLAAVIHYLRKKGWPIQTHLDMRRVAHYWFPRGWKPEDAGAAGAARGDRAGA